MKWSPRNALKLRGHGFIASAVPRRHLLGLLHASPLLGGRAVPHILSLWLGHKNPPLGPKPTTGLDARFSLLAEHHVAAYSRKAWRVAKNTDCKRLTEKSLQCWFPNQDEPGYKQLLKLRKQVSINSQVNSLKISSKNQKETVTEQMAEE